MAAELTRWHGHKPLFAVSRNFLPTFNSTQISLAFGMYELSQPKHVNWLRLVPSNATGQQVIAECARWSYIASVRWPDLLFSFPASLQYRASTPDAIDLLNRMVKLAQTHRHCTLWFSPLDARTCHIAVVSDERFPENPYTSSERGYLTYLADDKGATNINHYSGVKLCPMGRSALAAKLFPFADAFKKASILRVSINSMLN